MEVVATKWPVQLPLTAAKQTTNNTKAKSVFYTNCNTYNLQIYMKRSH